jgi:hypothetical protein
MAERTAAKGTQVDKKTDKAEWVNIDSRSVASIRPYWGDKSTGLHTATAQAPTPRQVSQPPEANDDGGLE